MNYRFYSFVAGNYLSPLQCGIQTAHAVAEMSQKKTAIYENWAKNDKTIIVLNAKNHKGVGEVARFMYNSELQKTLIDVSSFSEDEDSMNGMMTACGVLIPEFIYDAKRVISRQTNRPDGYEFETYGKGTFMETYKRFHLGSDEADFIDYLKSFRAV